MITTQELELEEQQSLLEMQFRCYIELDDRVKSPKDRADEAQILNMMLEVIDKRNDLITFRDEKRLNEITEQLRMAR
ncbi:F-actin-monooxygenase mical1-like isoform X2 [Ambystoma mexicanum]